MNSRFLHCAVLVSIALFMTACTEEPKEAVPEETVAIPEAADDAVEAVVPDAKPEEEEPKAEAEEEKPEE